MWYRLRIKWIVLFYFSTFLWWPPPCVWCEATKTKGKGAGYEAGAAAIFVQYIDAHIQKFMNSQNSTSRTSLQQQERTQKSIETMECYSTGSWIHNISIYMWTLCIWLRNFNITHASIVSSTFLYRILFCIFVYIRTEKKELKFYDKCCKFYKKVPTLIWACFFQHRKTSFLCVNIRQNSFKGMIEAWGK